MRRQLKRIKNICYRSHLPVSLQALRSSPWMLPQLTKSAWLRLKRKGFLGTLPMPVLSQMMLARDTLDSEAFCAAVKTPMFSHQSLGAKMKETQINCLSKIFLKKKEKKTTTKNNKSKSSDPQFMTQPSSQTSHLHLGYSQC